MYIIGHNMKAYLNKKFVLDVFKDKQQNYEFINNGFFIVDFLTVDEVNEAQLLLKNITIPKITLFHSHGHNDFALKAEIDRIFKDFIRDKIIRLEFFLGYKIYTAVYINKAPNANKAFMKIHSDNSLCDERNFMPFNLWIPLVDVNNDNGTFCMIIGSHLKTKTLRGSNTKDKYLENNKALFLKEYIPISMKKGSAMVYHPGCVHFSTPNYTEQGRPVIAFACIPKEAEPSLFFEKRSIVGNNKIYRYSFNTDEINNWNNVDMPSKMPDEIITQHEK